MRLFDSGPSSCMHPSPIPCLRPSPSPRAHARARRYESTSDNSESKSKSESLSMSTLKRRGLTEQLHPSSYYAVDVPTVDEPRAGHCVVRTFLRDRERITADSGWQTASVQATRVQATRCKVQGARCEVRGARCEVRRASDERPVAKCRVSDDSQRVTRRRQMPDPRCQMRAQSLPGWLCERNTKRVRLSASECVWGSDEARSRALSTGHWALGTEHWH